MPVPRRRRSSSKQGMNRAHKNMKAPAASVCPACKEPKKPHQACPSCGEYKGRKYKVNVTS